MNRQQIRANRLNIRLQILSAHLNTSISPEKPQPKDSERTSESSTSDFEEMLSSKCQTQQSFEQLFETKQKLGEGAQSVVKRVIDRNTGEEYAVKIMRHQDAETILKIKQQFKLMKTLDLPTLAQAHWLFISEKQSTCRLVLQLCMWPDLRNELDRFGKFNEQRAAEVLKALLETCDYLHSRGICHRDIKPENILYSLEESPCLKLVDFGISTYKYKKRQEMWTSTTGTLYYKAPQMFLGSYTNKVDVWAIGVVGYELLYRRTPFARESVNDTIHEILNSFPEFNEDTDPFAQDFIRRCLAKDPNERPSAREALKHPFMLRTNSRPVTPKINLNNSFDNDKDFLEPPSAEQSPVMNIRSLEQARKFSASNIMDLELGVKYEQKSQRHRKRDRSSYFN